VVACNPSFGFAVSNASFSGIFAALRDSHFAPAQQLELILTEFAEKFHRENATFFPSPRVLYRLFYFALLLNAEVHQQHVSASMTLVGFHALVDCLDPPPGLVDQL
jgi:hypothetical protein